MTQEINYHMSPEEFRHWGYQTIDWIANYMETVEDLPVLSQVKPGEIRANLPDAAPKTGESYDAILNDINRIIVPGLTHSNEVLIKRSAPSAV